MRIELSEVSASEAPVLSNLMSLYLHDFSEIFGGSPGSDGRFVYSRLPLYFKESGRSAFFIKSDGTLAGFALVSLGSVVSGAPDVWDLSEFFVARGLRRRGIGSTAASALFTRLGGAWEVRALDRNRAACKFWERTISQHTSGLFKVQPWESQSGSWRVFQFSNHHGAA